MSDTSTPLTVTLMQLRSVQFYPPAIQRNHPTHPCLPSAKYERKDTRYHHLYRIYTGRCQGRLSIRSQGVNCPRQWHYSNHNRPPARTTRPKGSSVISKCTKCASIEKVGQAMKPDGLCYVYLAGHAEQDSYETAFMPLPSGEHLDGKDLVAQLQAAGRNGCTFVVMADVCFAAGFIRLPYVYDGSDGSLSWSGNSEEGSHSKKGQVIALLSTDYNQLGVTIDNANKEPYPGYHGLFTWSLFNFLRNQPLEVELSKLLPYLRKHSGWHPSKPRPQISATAETFRKLPIGRP